MHNIHIYTLYTQELACVLKEKRASAEDLPITHPVTAWVMRRLFHSCGNGTISLANDWILEGCSILFSFKYVINSFLGLMDCGNLGSM